MTVLEDLSRCTGFDWDAGNSEKNWEQHGVSKGEAEEMFFNRPLIVATDVTHSVAEARYAALGRTQSSRQLTIIFTIRGQRIRVISTRDMSRQERRVYEKKA